MNAELRAAAERGEDTPLSAAGWLRFGFRLAGLLLLLLIFVPLHYLCCSCALPDGQLARV